MKFDSDEPIFLDCETIGLTGPIVLFQYAVGLTGDVILFNPWKNLIDDTLELFEAIVSHPGGVVGFNLAFDWFHIQQMYNVLERMPDRFTFLEDVVDLYAENEEAARDGSCLKPVKACDLMLHARKGPYQSTMDREDVRIKRIPTMLAHQLAEVLEEEIQFKPIYFARKKDKLAKHWQVHDILEDDGDINPNFKDIVCKFAPSSALKTLHADIFGVDINDVLLFSDVELPKHMYPQEYGYAPFNQAVKRAAERDGEHYMSWVYYAKTHYNHWEYNSLARKYAADDITKTRDLYKFFECPELGDDDSELACMVGAVRWKGMKINIEKMEALRKVMLSRITAVNLEPDAVRSYLEEVMGPIEKLIIKKSTKKIILEEVAEWKLDDETTPHPAALRAQAILSARKSRYLVQIIDKLLLAGRFHPSFVVIGTLSSRMSGSDDLNAQGMNALEEFRACFPLAFDDMILCGGDFSAFEITLADAVYNDPDLRADLLSGKKIHGLFGEKVFPDMTYDDIMASEGSEDDKYTRAKSAVFAMLYGGEAHTLKDRLGVEINVAEAAYQAFIAKYKQVGESRKKVFNMFCSMRQPGGIGSKVEWHEPSEYVENIFGFRRYFTLENRICKTLFKLAENPPKQWLQYKVKVIRRDRQQTVCGATRSALFAAAFAIQAAAMRAAANHVIQSSGAQVTKRVQRRMWDMQTTGVSKWLVMPMNIHDELEAPCAPEAVEAVATAVDRAVEEFREVVPLIKLKWQKNLNSWAWDEPSSKEQVQSVS